MIHLQNVCTFFPRQVTPNQFKLIQGGKPEHLKSGQGLASPNHSCSLPLPPPLEKLLPGETIYRLQNSGSICVQKFNPWKTYLFLSKYKKTRGPKLAPTAHETVNFSWYLKSKIGIEVPCYQLNFLPNCIAFLLPGFS